MKVGDLVRYETYDSAEQIQSTVGILVHLGKSTWGKPLWSCRNQHGGHVWRLTKNLEVLSESR